MTGDRPAEEYVERPTQVHRYRELNDRERELVNSVKHLEDVIAEAWKLIRDADDADRDTSDPTWDSSRAVYVDREWLDISRLRLQEGFSALIRAVTRPRDPFAD